MLSITQKLLRFGAISRYVDLVVSNRQLSTCSHNHPVQSQHNKVTFRIHYDGQPLGHFDSLLWPRYHFQTKLSSQTLQNHRVESYILPGGIQSAVHKRTILDPLTSPKDVRLPSINATVFEKLTPGLLVNFPKLDPHPLQRHIDEGTVKVPKVTMPYLIRIRKRKMKKHKLKKFRKRMIFLHRKLTEIKKRKKEKIMAEYQRNARQGAEEYSAEAFVDEQLGLARKGGYRVNIFATRSRE